MDHKSTSVARIEHEGLVLVLEALDRASFWNWTLTSKANRNHPFTKWWLRQKLCHFAVDVEGLWERSTPQLWKLYRSLVRSLREPSPRILKRIPTTLFDRTKVLSAAFATRGLLTAPPEIRDDRNIVLAVMESTGELEYVSARLQQDETVALAAIRRNGFSYEFAADKLKNDPIFAAKAVKLSGWAIGHVPQELRTAELVWSAKQAWRPIDWGSMRAPTTKPWW